MTEASIFAAALGKSDVRERAEFVADACGSNEPLRRRVHALLKAHDAPDDVLEPIAQALPTAKYEPLEARDGTVLGPYTLRERIGEGGFGLVYVAEQQEPVRRKVALKVIKPGMDTRAVVARFEAERQALALMDHPNIAKVLDAGSTENGNPYFVMELVKGMPITQFADAHNLTPQERLRLFVQVCQAVQHAHQKGVIHRDIKPSNVLVTVIDGAPIPKVIDFGVAKAVGQQLTEKTIYTQFAAMVGTPLYMSPEQAELSGVDVDTRADVYALGVLLYELLTGTTPFDGERFKKAAFDEIRRIIKEEEPPRPSTRLTALGESLSATAAKRGTEPGKLPSVVRGELDWIVMKCLEKDRARRYETANGLTKDVQRFLAGDAVEACPPTFGYKVRKAFRKNRAAVLTAASFAVVLLVATGVSLAFGLQAKRQERRALEHEKVAADNAAQALASRAEAHRERDDAVASRRSLARLEYARSMQLAYQSWHNGHAGQAVRLIDEAQPEFRDWEWHFLNRLCHPETLTMTDPNNKIYYASFSADGSQVVTIDFAGVVAIWDVRTGARVRSFTHGVSELGANIVASFNPDGTKVLTAHGSVDKPTSAIVWDVRTGIQVQTLSVPNCSVVNAVFDRDGKRIVTTHRTMKTAADFLKPGSRDMQLDTTVRVWDANTAKELLLLDIGPYPVRDVSFGDDGARIIAAGMNEKESNSAIKIWDAKSGRVLLDLPIPHAVVNTARLSPDGARIVAAVWSGTTRIFDAKTGAVVRALNAASSEGHSSAEFGPDGTSIVCGDGNDVTILDSATGEIRKRWRGHNQSVRTAKFSADGKRVVSADGTAKVWNVDDGRDPVVIPEKNREGGWQQIAFGSDGTWIVTGNDRDLTIWNAANGAVIRKAETPEKVAGISLSGDGKRILTLLHNRWDTGKPDKVSIWDTQTMKPVLDLKLGKETSVRNAVISPDGRWIATGQWDMPRGNPVATVWDAATGNPVHTLTGHKGHAVRVASFSPDSKRLLTFGVGYEKTAVIWDVLSGKKLAGFQGGSSDDQHTFMVDAGFSPDGTKVVSLLNGKGVIWDANTGKELKTLQGVLDYQHGSYVAFSPNGKRIVIAPGTAGASIWDSESGNMLLDLKSTEGDGWHFALSPDGAQIALKTMSHLEIYDARPFPKSAPPKP